MKISARNLIITFLVKMLVEIVFVVCFALCGYNFTETLIGFGLFVFIAMIVLSIYYLYVFFRFLYEVGKKIDYLDQNKNQ